TLWMNHLDEIDYLRQGIGLRGYGQRDPLVEYKREAFNLFSHLMENMRSTTVKTLFKVSMVSAEPATQVEVQPKNVQYHGAQDNVSQFGATEQVDSNESGPQQPIVNKDKVGRNDPCPCGSGNKYKNCHGK
ncbi:MAG TPA: SEC-C metal-binding domain-containing protein, partial [Patescibacteria group bacterium]